MNGLTQSAAADCAADVLKQFHDRRVVQPFEMIETCSTGLRIWLKFPL
jgi:hypothetical protein